MSRPKISQLAAEVQQSEAGRFQLTRRGRLVFLDVAVDGKQYEKIQATHADREAWDWGEDDR